MPLPAVSKEYPRKEGKEPGGKGAEVKGRTPLRSSVAFGQLPY